MTRKPDGYIVDRIMGMIENYRMSGGRVEHHANKARIEHALSLLVAGTHQQPGADRFSISTDKTSVVSNESFWIPIDENTPRGKKLWLINKPAGSATQGQYDLDPFWTHYFPLPRFEKEDSNET